jgi:dienelactone hydrolase
MSQGDFAAVETQFDETMQSQLPAGTLKGAWDQIVANYGPYQGQKDVTTSQQGGFNNVVVTTQFASTDLNIRAVFGQDGRVAGLFFQPANPSVMPTYVPPPYVDESKFSERDVTIGSGQWQLPGTLSIPAGKGPFPGVVLVQGSGPEDRDETIGANKPFRDLAWGLASQGIAVLRYDKRTFAHQQQIASILDTITVKDEVTDDAELALDLLKTEQGVDPNKVFLLGHSLGGMLVPMIVQQKPGIAGAIVMAGPTRPFEDLLLDQANYIAGLDGVVSDTEQQQLDILKNQVANVKKPDLSSSTPSTDLPLGLPASYWLSLRDYHPEQVAAGQKVPMLIMQGLRDYEVKQMDFDGWKNALLARSNVTFKEYPNLNHIFKEGQGMGTPDEYNMPGHVSQQVVKDISDWIGKQ